MNVIIQCGHCGSELDTTIGSCLSCGYPVGASRLNIEGATYGKTRFR